MHPEERGDRPPGVSKQEHKKTEFLEALEQTLGVVSTACNRVGIPYSRYRKWLERDPDFKDKVEAISDIALDYVETQLFRQIQEGNAQATMFYLRTKGKHRGYVENPALNVNTFTPVQILLPNGVEFPPLGNTIGTNGVIPIETEEEDEEE
jgi:hypothetical protein